MATHKKNRFVKVAGLTAAALALTVSPASASTGAVSSGVSTGNGSVNATCAYTATLPSTSINRIEVAVAATATTTARVGVNPAVSTAVNCYLKGTDATGGTGITSLGSAAAIAGRGSFGRLTTPQLCVTATASYLNGTTDQAPERCVSIDASTVIDPSEFLG